MNILLVTTKKSGGAARACLMQLRAFQTSHHNVKLLVLFGDGHSEPSIIEHKKSDQFSMWKRIRNRLYHEIGKRFSRHCSDGVYLPFGVYDISQSAHFEDADVVIFHWCYHFVDFSRLPRKGKRYFWVCHDMAPFNGGIPYELHAKTHRLSTFKRFTSSRLSKMLNGMDLTFVFPSQWLRSQYEQSALHPTYSAATIPYSCDFDSFAKGNSAYQRNPNQLCFVAAAVNNPRKGFGLLLEALLHVETPCDVVVIGEAKDLELDDTEHHRMHAVGFIQSQHDIAGILSQSSLFVIPSVEDNLPNTVLESLMCGTPVVGYDVGGMPDMVKPGFSGWLAKATTSTSLASAIQKGLNSDWNHEEIHRDACRRFSHDMHVENWERVLA